MSIGTREAPTRNVWRDRVVTVWRERLFQSSAYLMINMVMGAAVGFVFFTVIARIYPPGELGLATTVLSATNSITTIASLGITFAIVRFLGEARDRRALVNTSTVLIGTATLVVTIVALLVPAFTGKLYALGGATFVVVFLSGTMASAWHGLAETVFIADRGAREVVWVNTIGNAARLTLPFVLLPMGAIAVYLATTGAWVVAGVIFAVLLVRNHGHRFRVQFDRGAVRTIGRFSGGSYLSNIVGSLPITLLPIVILTRLGAAASAFWYIAITIAMLLYSLPSVVSQSLMVEGAHRPSERLRLVRHSAAAIALVMLPAIAVVYVAAPLLLSVFGHEYVTGSVTALRLLVLSAVMVSINYVTGTVLYLAKRVFVITLINVVDAVVVLGLTLTVVDSVTGVAMAWFIGEVFNVVLFAIAAVMAVRRQPEEWRRDLTEVAAGAS